MSTTIPAASGAAPDLSSTVHRLYVIGYGVTLTLAIMVSASSGVVSDYWKDIIDGCILYADIQQNHNDSWVMLGSDISVCNYVRVLYIFLFIAVS